MLNCKIYKIDVNLKYKMKLFQTKIIDVYKKEKNKKYKTCFVFLIYVQELL